MATRKKGRIVRVLPYSGSAAGWYEVHYSGAIHGPIVSLATALDLLDELRAG